MDVWKKSELLKEKAVSFTLGVMMLKPSRSIPAISSTLAERPPPEPPPPVVVNIWTGPLLLRLPSTLQKTEFGFSSLELGTERPPRKPPWVIFGWMEPENIDWDNIDSTFIHDDTYENFDAPKWVDLSAASNEPLVDDDDEIWFCTQDCKHPKISQNLLKPTTTTTTNSKAKLLRLASFSEILPFKDRNRRENPSAVKDCDKPRRPNCSRNMDEDNENKNPNFTVTNLDGGTNNLKKPLLRSKSNTKRDNLKELNDSKECPPERSNRRSKLKSTFSAQNLLGGREILSQITGFCSELKRLATRKGSTKKGGGNEKGSNSNGVLEELKEKSKGRKERVPLLVVKEGTLE